MIRAWRNSCTRQNSLDWIGLCVTPTDKWPYDRVATGYDWRHRRHHRP